MDVIIWYNLCCSKLCEMFVLFEDEGYEVEEWFYFVDMLIKNEIFDVLDKIGFKLL